MRRTFCTFQAFTFGLFLITSGCFLLPPSHSDYRPIHQYSLGCDAATVQEILKTNSAAVNLGDDSKRTALHAAASRNCTNVIAVLLGAGAEIEARDKVGETPLHVAAQEGCAEAVTMLVTAGAKINVRDAKGYTPLGRAVAYEQATVVKLLRNLGGKE